MMQMRAKTKNPEVSVVAVAEDDGFPKYPDGVKLGPDGKPEIEPTAVKLSPLMFAGRRVRPLETPPPPPPSLAG